MNLAIVLAVSDYPPTLGQLPACQNDAKAVATLLRTDSKFDEVLVLTDGTSSAVVKEKLIEFISHHKDTSVEEVVFYYSGHGEFTGDEFYYILSDYDPKRRKQTALENSEVDNLLRTLNPKLAVKLIDACNAGVAYIKDTEAFNSYLKGTQAPFTSCYFLFSSQADQSSYQDQALSFFTRSIIDAVLEHPTESIRYKDVIDFVSDAFAADPVQTPYFVVQADFTEPFCTASETLRAAVRAALEPAASSVPSTSSGVQQSNSLVARVKDEAAEYCTEEEAMKILGSVLEFLRAVETPLDALELFDVTVEAESEYSRIPSPAALGNWLAENEHNFFARPHREPVEVTRRVRKFSFLSPNSDDKFQTVTAIEQRVRGFRSTVDMPFTSISVRAEPRYPNLRPAVCILVPILSRTEIRFFSTHSTYRLTGWSGRELEEEIKWTTATVRLKSADQIHQYLESAMERFWKYVLDALREKFGLLAPANAGKSAEAATDPDTPEGAA